MKHSHRGLIVKSLGTQRSGLGTNGNLCRGDALIMRAGGGCHRGDRAGRIHSASRFAAI